MRRGNPNISTGASVTISGVTSLPADGSRNRPPAAIEAARPSSIRGVSDAAEERELLQQRLVLFGQLTVAICVFFYVVSQFAIYLGFEVPWSLLTHIVMGIEAALGLATWLYCRGPHRQLDALRRLELALSFAVMQAAWIVAATLPLAEPGMRPTVMLLGFNLAVYIRSVFIPSSATRMALLGGIASLPLIIYSFSTMPLRYAFWTIPWSLSGVSVATLGAWVIYGLRREAAHARRLGQYTLEQKLGEGGMGVVYRASHAMLRRPTAVKLLRSEKGGEQALLRFEREVQRTAELSHPNTVSIYDFGRTPDGVFYYAMEYLDGIDLQHLVDGDGAQLPERVVHILRQVLGALGEAHSVGLIHRDIKPGNIILCERGGVPDVAKVVDFGLVKELDTADGLSQEGALVGTPLYMAPESIRSGAADPRSDIYAVGAVAYYLLTGVHVFTGQTVIEICGHHLHTAPVAPSERIGHALPPDLEAWVMRCLEKSPDSRPASAAEAERELAAADDGSWRVERAHEWWRQYGADLKRGPEPDADVSGPGTGTMPVEVAGRLAGAPE